MTFDPFLIPARDFEPAYLNLYRQGALDQRAETALDHLRKCTICPRACEINRLAGEVAVCQTGRYAHVASHFAHQGEEDVLRGSRGSGTLFFGMCGLRCVFCQNYETSQTACWPQVRPQRLAGMMLELQDAGAHNINLVTPSHVVPQIIEALAIAVPNGLRLPLVYNSSGYDSLTALSLLDGIVDIYMPDFKFWGVAESRHYLKAPDYPEGARAALMEMHRQVGPLKVDEHGIARRGVLVRHLVMPGHGNDTAEIMRFLAEEVSRDTYVNLMGQYYPSAQVGPGKYVEINRRITDEEQRAAQQAAVDAGLWRFDERRARRLWQMLG